MTSISSVSEFLNTCKIVDATTDLTNMLGSSTDVENENTPIVEDNQEKKRSVAQFLEDLTGLEFTRMFDTNTEEEVKEEETDEDEDHEVRKSSVSEFLDGLSALTSITKTIPMRGGSMQ